MEDELPTEFDLIVIGTGFTESIVAAAASRIGKTVLHIDPNEFYGSIWSSFNLESFQSFIENCNKTKNDDTKLEIIENCCDIVNAKHLWHIPDDELFQEEKCGGDTEEKDEYEAKENEKNEIEESLEAREWTKSKVFKEFRKFNIDLSPKLLFASGKLVNLLISSNICRYAEFRAVDRVCTVMDDQIKNVPCSRSDVFNTKDVNVVEKRLLMKLLTSCMNSEEHPEEFADYEGKTFLEYLKGNKLTDNIIHYVLYAISMSNDSTPLTEGIAKTKRFLLSLGRYGNTPFLFPMYGCGEIPQCFCRLCAVFGGIYCLKRQVEGLECTGSGSDKSIKSIKFGKQEIKLSHLVVGSSDYPRYLLKDIPANSEEKSCGNISRGMFITSTPLGGRELNSGGGGVNLLKLQGTDGSEGAIVIQLSHYSGTCPKGLYLIHITCQSRSDDAEADLKPYTDIIFNQENSPKILYSVYFKIPKCVKCTIIKEKQSLIPKNVFIACNPTFELDYDQSIQNAHDIFNKIYPDETFLPRAPDPEEIVIGDEDPEAIKAEEALPDDVLREQIRELQEGIENQALCDEENSKNEELK